MALNIYGGYRNEAFYQNYLKGRSADEAYRAIQSNLKSPTFSHEADCALRVYEQMFGMKFQSEEKRTIESLEEENAKLRRLISSQVIEKKEEPALENFPDPAALKVEKQSEVVAVTEFPKGMDKEAFKTYYSDLYEKSQGVKPTGLTWGRAWKKYNAESQEG